VSLNRSREDFHVAQSGLNFGFGTGGTGSADFTQSRPGGGTVAQAFTNDNSYRDTQVYTTRYTHDGRDWRFDASLSYTSGNRRTTDVADGTFSGLTASYSALNLRADGIAVATDGGFPRITATNAAGTSVNVFDGGGLPITAAAGATGRDNHDTISSAKADLERTFSLRIPLKLKAGLARTSERLDLNASPQAWTVAIPGAPANTARNLGLTADAYSNVLQWYDIDGQREPVTLISAASLYALYKAHPEYFTLNEAAAYMGVVNNSKVMRETITAGYMMGDTKLFNNRLRLVGGVRYEKTDDAGMGPKNDVSATYVQDANGNIVRNSTGAPVKVTTDALGLAKLQYTLRAAKTDRSYDGFYPSLNAIYYVSDKVLVRCGYAQTIARPAMSQILPGVTLPDPTGTSRRITLNNTGLRPWSANNYDLSVEAYGVRDATISVGVFRKDLQDFFISTTTTVTADTLEEFGLGNEFNGYDLVTMRNGGSATLTGVGVELSPKPEVPAPMGAWLPDLLPTGPACI
jgi:iron complex outermembrane receptor protein